MHITPINYAVDGDTLLFRTAEGSKLLAVVMNPDIAFETDHYGEESATSVILRGTARQLDELEEHRAENVPAPPVGPDRLKYNVVEITPDRDQPAAASTSSRPWLHIAQPRSDRPVPPAGPRRVSHSAGVATATVPAPTPSGETAGPLGPPA